MPRTYIGLLSDSEATKNAREDRFFMEAIGASRALQRACWLNEAPLLLRIDSGQDALENIDLVLDHNKDDPTGVDFRITWSPRREDPKQWLGHAGAHARFTPRRPGKRVAPCSTTL